MDGLAKKILDALRLYKKESNKKVLKTSEEVEANTSDNYLVAAPVVGELINNLTTRLPGDVKLIVEGSGANTKYYAQKGADTASKKLLGDPKKLLQGFTCVAKHEYTNNNIHEVTYTATKDCIAIAIVHDPNSITTTGQQLFTTEKLTEQPSYYLTVSIVELKAGKSITVKSRTSWIYTSLET